MLSYDNLCNLDRLHVAKKPLPITYPYSHLWLSITRVIDKLNLMNHVNASCRELYNPDALKDRFTHLNTPVAEQTFVWAARFKKILGAMPKSHFLFFYHRTITQRNATPKNDSHSYRKLGQTVALKTLPFHKSKCHIIYLTTMGVVSQVIKI